MATEPTPDTQLGGASPDGAATLDDHAILASKAERCRRLAAGISDRQAADVLRTMAVNYEKSAQDRLQG
ncbi:hypothetical protein ACFQPG_09875 [Sphingomonas sp. GCM10030256]|uniref:hypothetical protein n=1 Tax=Sphingomonas sp. GCM10030256 TaxID=3273427 RepID=UPI003605D268